MSHVVYDGEAVIKRVGERVAIESELQENLTLRQTGHIIKTKELK